MRIIGLDIGEKRIGVAVSDLLGKTAQGVGIVNRGDLEGDINEIKNLVDEYKAESLVVGLPLNMNGTSGKGAKAVTKFIEALDSALKIPVATYDERLSTKESEKLLISSGVSRRRRKETIDMIAAQLILQSYLDSLSSDKKKS